MKCGTNKTINISNVIKYLKSNFVVFLMNIKQINNRSIATNKYKNKYLDKNPKAAKNPTKKQSLNLISFES